MIELLPESCKALGFTPSTEGNKGIKTYLLVDSAFAFRGAKNTKI